MPAPLIKLIPTLMLMAIFGYLGWSYFDTASAPNAPAASMPEIAADHLRPVAPDETQRDPFGDSVRFEVGETSDEKPGPRARNKPAGATKAAGTAVTGKGFQDQGKTGAAGPRSTATVNVLTGATSEASGKTSANNAPATRTVAAQAPTELVLNATVLHNQKQIAVINGHAYGPGEPIVTSDSEKPFRIVEVHHHRVVLICDGKLMNLGYLDGSVDPKSGSTTRAGKTKKVKLNPKGAGGASPASQPGTQSPPTR
jgi:hypothetical protein